MFDKVIDLGLFWVFPNFNREVKFWKVIAKRPMSLKEYSYFVKHSRVGPLDGFVSKSGNHFSASLIFKPISGGGGEVVFDFSSSFGGIAGPVSPKMTGPGAKKKYSSSTGGEWFKKKPPKTW